MKRMTWKEVTEDAADRSHRGEGKVEVEWQGWKQCLR